MNSSPRLTIRAMRHLPATRAAPTRCHGGDTYDQSGHLYTLRSNQQDRHGRRQGQCDVDQYARGAAIADNAAGYAAYSLMDADASILTVEFKLNLLAPGNGTLLTARGRVIKAGRQLSVCRSDVFVRRDGEEQQCAVALVTLIQLVGRPDSPLSS